MGVSFICQKQMFSQSNTKGKKKSSGLAWFVGIVVCLANFQPRRPAHNQSLARADRTGPEILLGWNRREILDGPGRLACQDGPRREMSLCVRLFLLVADIFVSAVVLYVLSGHVSKVLT